MLNTDLEIHTIPSLDVISKPPSSKAVDAFSTLTLRLMIRRERKLTEPLKREKRLSSPSTSGEMCVLLSSLPYPAPLPFLPFLCWEPNSDPVGFKSSTLPLNCSPTQSSYFEAICSLLEICRLLPVPYSKSITSVCVSVTKPMLKKSDGNILADAFSLIYTVLEKPCSSLSS